MKKLACVVIGLAMSATAFAEPAPDSKRLALAKDYIADEQWTRAIAELRVVSNDTADPNRDEALFWLAHSEHQVGDQQAAVDTIRRLERLYPRSRWVRPARSLRIEIAQRLQRDDVLWFLAQPTPLPPPPSPRAFQWTDGLGTPDVTPPIRVWTTPVQPAPPPPAVPRGHVTPPPTPIAPGAPATVMPAGVPSPTAAPRPGVPPDAPTPRPGVPPRPMVIGLLPEGTYTFETDLQIEALVGLLEAHSDRAIPLLREIAFDTKNPADARRAVFALSRSTRTEARNTVVEVARRGPRPVRVAAIREIGRFPEATYTATLLSIARAESDPAVRDTAIVTLGRSGARVPLRTLYTQLPASSRYTVLTAMGNAKDDDELIRIATNERDQALRTRARQQLRLLATPKAIKFLTENP